MKHPFQSLLACPAQGSRQEDLLIAAAGPYLYAYNLNQGTLVSSWHQEPTSPATSNRPNPPPPKKRRLSSAGTETAVPPTSPPADHPGKNDGQVNQESDVPSIVQLAKTRSGGHVVAVTDRDKCLRVFALDPSGQLTPLSERFMPKRPSAIAITDDDATIICADKFGDVYALPLLGTSSGEDSNVPMEKKKLSADFTTVHTARNQQILQDQLRESKDPEPKSIDFSYQILLGHVSMITDLALATIVEEGSSEPKMRNYILTCDRDEHIRISRGMPQSHVIEGYCLGHKQFVNRIAIPRSRPNILISGGGDDCLYVWDWVSGNLLDSIMSLHLLVEKFLHSDYDLLDVYVAEYLNSKPSNRERGETRNDPLDDGEAGDNRATSPSDLHRPSVRDSDVPHVAVTGIWTFIDTSESGTPDEAITRFFVACEGISALFAFHLSEKNSLVGDGAMSLKGNALSVAIYETMASIVVSVDNIHKPCSTTRGRDSPTDSEVLLQCFSRGTDSLSYMWEENANRVQQIESINREGSFDTSGLDSMSGLLYTVENLRKRGTED